MPRPYQPGHPGGTSMTGHAYEPDVTPWNRDDDDYNVTGQRAANREVDRDGEYGSDARQRQQHDQNQDRSNSEQDPYYRRDLQPAYGDRDDHRSHDDKDRHDHENYRPQTNQGGADDRYEVRGRFDKDYKRDHDDDRDTRSRNDQDDPWRNAYPRRTD